MWQPRCVIFLPYLRNQKFLASLFGYSRLQPLHELFYRSVGSDHAVRDWALVVPEQGFKYRAPLELLALELCEQVCL